MYTYDTTLLYNKLDNKFVAALKYQYVHICIIWSEILVPLKFGEIDNQPKIQQIFTIQIFTHL